jgi:hypothetical protein
MVIEDSKGQGQERALLRASAKLKFTCLTLARYVTEVLYNILQYGAVEGLYPFPILQSSISQTEPVSAFSCLFSSLNRKCGASRT